MQPRRRPRTDRRTARAVCRSAPPRTAAWTRWSPTSCGLPAEPPMSRLIRCSLRGEQRTPRPQHPGRRLGRARIRPSRRCAKLHPDRLFLRAGLGPGRRGPRRTLEHSAEVGRRGFSAVAPVRKGGLLDALPGRRLSSRCFNAWCSSPMMRSFRPPRGRLHQVPREQGRQVALSRCVSASSPASLSTPGEFN